MAGLIGSKLVKNLRDQGHDAVAAAPGQARYNGISVTERTLIPEGNARLGKIRFEDWLARPATQTPLRLAAKDRLTHTTHENKIDRAKG